MVRSPVDVIIHPDDVCRISVRQVAEFQRCDSLDEQTARRVELAALHRDARVTIFTPLHAPRVLYHDVLHIQRFIVAETDGDDGVIDQVWMVGPIRLTLIVREDAARVESKVLAHRVDGDGHRLHVNCRFQVVPRVFEDDIVVDRRCVFASRVRSARPYFARLDSVRMHWIIFRGADAPLHHRVLIPRHHVTPRAILIDRIAL
mmetsp:Transcript_7096/g.28684  ORF Transcript_7096/g.28684 Transcript_7096/m.28684 type:complete len:203 (+) Transcript_7096:396-1004(+)